MVYLISILILFLFSALSFCCAHGRSPGMVWLNLGCLFYTCLAFKEHISLHNGGHFLCRDYLSPSDIMGSYPHLVIAGTGLAFGFLVVRFLWLCIEGTIEFLLLYLFLAPIHSSFLSCFCFLFYNISNWLSLWIPMTETC